MNITNITTIIISLILVAVTALAPPPTSTSEEAADTHTCQAPCEYDAARDAFFCPCP